MDVSSSVDAREYRLMMEGTAAALRAPEVQAAFMGDRPVALAAFLWAGERETTAVAGWEMMVAAAALDGFADRVAGFRRPGDDALDTWGGLTAVGAALMVARTLLDAAPACDAQTVDLAGDGPNNAGPEPGPLRAAHFAGVTINALAVGGELAGDYHLAAETVDELSAWYAAHVLHGPGAFVEPAAGYDDFERAMTRKLLRELMPPLMSLAGPAARMPAAGR